MKSHLIITPTKGMSRSDWLYMRWRDGIGASESGTVLGLNPYKHKAQLFWEKTNPIVENSIENMAMFMGLFMENPIAEMWQYWEGSEESLIQNYRAGKIVRRCQRVNACIKNPKYPWLFASLDRKINKINGTGEGSLEMKTIASYEAEKWEAGVPAYQLIQLQQQILICEFDFGELGILRDGRNFDVLPFDSLPNMQEIIIEETKNFWDDVIEGRKIQTQIYAAKQEFNYRKVEDLEGALQMLEPEPDGTEAYQHFLKERFRDKPLAEAGIIAGTDEDYDTALQFLAVKERMKALKEEEMLHGGILRRKIGDKSKLDFGKRGFVSWNGNPRRFTVKVK